LHYGCAVVDGHWFHRSILASKEKMD